MNGSTLIADVIGNPLLEGYGRFLFPITFNTPRPGDTLADVPDLLTWYHHVDTATTIDVVGDLLMRRENGQTVFFNIYTEQERAAAPGLEDTGLFVFPAQGVPTGAKPHVAICNAGGGFAYVASIHDSMPHALWLSRHGYTAFTLQYRPGARTGCEDLARAISFIHTHADELGVDPEGYSLWGGSAGARLAAYLGSYGPARFGGDDVPRPGAVVMQYTGHSDLSGAEPPTFACVGTADPIASWRTMRARTDAIAAAGTPSECRVFEGLPHGFGLGIATAAEGWIEDAAAFWQAQIDAASAASAPSAGPATVREYVRLDYSPTFSGIDLNHVSPDPDAVEGTVATAAVDPTRSQCLFLWDEGGAPTTTTPRSSGYDPAGFRPTVTSIPAVGGTVRGAVLLCAGGAFAVRGNNSDCYPTAEQLSASGYHCFVVDYRLRPYTQAEAGTDLARAIRFVRAHADDYGLPSPQHIALGGYSAGGILCGETILNWSGSTCPAELDAGYTPDGLDSVSADVTATAMIYSFYGRLSVAELNPDRLAGAVPTYYCYGTRDPFYNQFEAQVEVMAARGATHRARVLDGWPHGFGAEGGWIEEYDAFMQRAFAAA
ncbi:alpha/beta hydrolase [Actinomyces sp. MRS3W]|uniref:alpha/beta hydrolase n=1 Tax=Actinomyces sp. MRS3W TaxID=2800796 RepID=UPI0028FDAEE1|nr:alpha/beta hydrolase [Actinomyces sp. MRS3W]MDU0348009.1 alpha/beta hydrolase [Actinomyces sp. MRS3W]